MKKVKSKYVSQWLAMFVMALILAEIISMSASYADSLQSCNLNPSSHTNLQVHTLNASIAAKPQVDNIQNEDKRVHKKYLTDAHLLQDATTAPRPQDGTPRRIAFMFIVRDAIPHEPLWKRFFEGHEAQYSLYVHATPGYAYPKGSLFEGREVPSKPSPRFSRGLVDSIRRLLAYALLDLRYNNVWFVNVCESSIPIRGFSFVYAYLMKSNVSFVESFFPVAEYHSWKTLPEFPTSELRKGEMWMALKRDHAKLVVSDSEIYFVFVAKCTWWCTLDEQYLQTLLHLRDGGGIAERTVMYVNWTKPHGGSPAALAGSIGVIKELESRMMDKDGERHDTAFDNTTRECVHNGVAPSPCFLFARKFAPSETKVLLSLKPEDLGY